MYYTVHTCNTTLEILVQKNQVLHNILSVLYNSLCLEEYNQQISQPPQTKPCTTIIIRFTDLLIPVSKRDTQ